MSTPPTKEPLNTPSEDPLISPEEEELASAQRPVGPKRSSCLWIVLGAILLLLLCACLFTGLWLTGFRAPSPAVPPEIETPVPDGLSGRLTAEPTMPPTSPPPPATRPGGDLVVHFIDVGQGDATLLVGPDFAILVDAGRHDRDDVLPYLQSVGIDHLDLLVGTHPHADHIGQFPQVLGALTVDEVWLSGDEHTTLTYERALDAILASEAGYHEPRAGEVFTFGSMRVEVLHPDRLTGRLHDGSISLRIVYGEVAFVLTGDAETKAEEEMLARGHALQAHVFQLGHHGSRTSNSAPFLRAISPEIAIYSAALGNSYGHPHDEVLQALEALGIPVYGTDQHGTILVITDGQQIALELDRGPEGRLQEQSRAVVTWIPHVQHVSGE